MRRASSASGLVALLALGLGGASSGMGCGASGGSSGTGSVAVLVTDAPGSEFERIELLVSKVELVGASRVELFSGRETVELRSLESFSNPVFVATHVPVGGYQRVRLTLEDVALVRELDDGHGGTVVEELHAQPPGGGVIDLVPRGSFFVLPGATLMLEIAVDGEKAIQDAELGGGGYRVRPVAFVRIMDGKQEFRKPARVHGEIRNFLGPHAFSLCSREIRATRGAGQAAASSASCLEVNVPARTRIVDGPGNPVTLDEIGSGDAVTVVGELQLLRGAAALSTVPGQPTRDVPFALAALDGADIQLDAFTVAVGPAGVEPRDDTPESIAARTGGLGSLDPETRRFDLASTAGTECIDVAMDAKLLLLADDGYVVSASEISLDDLVDGQTVEVFGAPGTHCFVADALLAIAG